MILSKTLPDPVIAAAKPDAGASGPDRDGAQKQFGGILANLSDGSAAGKSVPPASKDAARPDLPLPPLTLARSATTSFAAASANIAAQPVAGSDLPPSTAAASTGTTDTGLAEATGSAVASLADLLATLPASAPAVGPDPGNSPLAGSGRRTAGPKAAAATLSDTAASVGPPTTGVALLSGLIGLVPLSGTLAKDRTPAKDKASVEDKASVTDKAPVTGTASSTGTASPMGKASPTDAPSSAVTAETAAGGGKAGAINAGQEADAAVGSLPSATKAVSDASSRDERSFADAAPVVTSATLETHLAPAPTLPPLQQVIDTVQKLAAAAGTPASSAPTTSPATAQVSSQTLTLVLQPQDLGPVTVRLQLRGGSLDLQLDVANAQTLGLLARDKDNLSAALSGQDYSVGSVTLRAAETQAAFQGSDPGQPQDQGSGSHPSSQNGESQQNASQQNAGGFSFSDGSPGNGSPRGGAPDDQGALREPRAAAPGPVSGVYI